MFYLFILACYRPLNVTLISYKYNIDTLDGNIRILIALIFLENSCVSRILH